MSFVSDARRNSTRSRELTFVSSGFNTVDIIFEKEVRAAPGGTATNVARALQSLGWKTSVIGTVGNDPPGRLFQNELEKDGVSTAHLRLEEDWTTPVLLQIDVRGDHAWRFSCPICGARFASHRPGREAVAEQIFQRMQAPDVYFFDRVSLFTLALAKSWSAQGTFVVFEPATLGRPHLFELAVEIADLIKFSEERAPAFLDRLFGASGILVETLGANGARFREPGVDNWHHVDVEKVRSIVDSAGAGDWTSAGIIHDLYADDGQKRIDKIERALLYGQELGALACSWEGVFPMALKTIAGNFEDFACPRVLKQSHHPEQVV